MKVVKVSSDEFIVTVNQGTEVASKEYALEAKESAAESLESKVIATQKAVITTTNANEAIQSAAESLSSKEESVSASITSTEQAILSASARNASEADKLAAKESEEEATRQAVISTEQAVIATEQASDSATSKTQSEAARDEIFNYEPLDNSTYTEVSTVKSKNLFNENIVTINKYVNWVYGPLSNSTSYISSDWIAVEPLQSYNLYSISHFVWYDINKAFISGQKSNVDNQQSPTNAKFLRVSFNNALLDVVQIEIGSSFTGYETYFEPYNLIELNERVTASKITDSIKESIRNGLLPLSPLFEKEKTLNFNTTTSNTFQYESSTFSGWGTPIGIRQAFQAIGIKIRTWDINNPITLINVRVRIGNETGTILAEKTASIDSVDINNNLIVLFDNIINSAEDLWIEYLTDGLSGMVYQNKDIGQDSLVISKYTTSRQINGTVLSDVTGGSNIVMYADFYSIVEGGYQLSTAGKAKLNEDLNISPNAPRINLPDRIHSVIGYEQQLFYRGMIESNNPYQWNIKINTTLSGNQFPRYYQFNHSTVGSYPLTISLYNDDNELITSKTTIVEVLSPTTSPASVKKVLCVGDSLTAAGIWTGEMLRMLTGTGGTPTALELTNIELIGTQGSGTNLYEGYGGWTWSRHLSSDSPFWNPNTSEIDFQYYVDTHGFGTIDNLMTLLTWNGQAGGRALASDHIGLITDAKTFLDKLKFQFPNATVKLLGIQLPSFNGGLGLNYGDADSGYGNYYELVRTVFGLNLAYQELANESGYSEWVSFENTSAQFDNENNMPEADANVNLRSAKTEKRGTNGVHPNTEGYYQIADVAFRAFNSF